MHKYFYLYAILFMVICSTPRHPRECTKFSERKKIIIRSERVVQGGNEIYIYLLLLIALHRRFLLIHFSERNNYIAGEDLARSIACIPKCV